MAAAVALCLGTTAQGATPPCLAPAEAQALVATVLPDTLSVVGDRCAPALPPGATLRGGLATLVARYRAEALASQALAVVATRKLLGRDAAALTPDTMLKVMSEAIGGEIVKGLDPKDCPRLDRAAGLLAPLPPANVAGLVIMVLQTEDGRKGSKDFSVCPAV